MFGSRFDLSDDANRQLQALVRPPGWKNPQPAGKYNLVVIGAGTGGLVTAAGAAGLGARVALIERDQMGGDCLNYGCVPSKALLAAARQVADARGASRTGPPPGDFRQLEFAAAMKRMRLLRAGLAPHDSADRFRKLGVDVYFGTGRFVDSTAIEVDGIRLPFHRAVIATGAQAQLPPIPGIDRVPFLTYPSLFELDELPLRLGIIGGGPIGCEMAQAFARFGSSVSLWDQASRLLPREDPEASAIVSQALVRDGVQVWTGCQNLELTHDGKAIRVAVLNQPGIAAPEVDQLLVAAGRRPNIDSLNLAAAGIESDDYGIRVNDFLQTSQPRVYAVGDVCSRLQFTHAAEFMARIVIQNALFLGRRRFSKLVIPWCTYTSPELARVGIIESEASDQGQAVDVFQVQFADIDRAVIEGRTAGFIKILTRRRTDQIVGATLVGDRAGELIGAVSLAMTNRLGLRRIAQTIHPYPTVADAFRRVADQYQRSRLTPRIHKLLSAWLRWRRK